MDSLAGIAGTAFGSELKNEVQTRPTPECALGSLIAAVPREVPVALLVDEYDAAIIADVTKQQWNAAKAGIRALKSLLMGTKSLDFGSRIRRSIVTGVAKFARPLFVMGANNFMDFTSHPLMSAAIGFTEQEIRTVFPNELQRLALSIGTDVDGTIAELARHYNGYCFDGQTTCFNPHGVLSALARGKLTAMEMEAASETNWLGLTPGVTLLKLSAKLQAPVDTSALDSSELDIADLDSHEVKVIPLLLQTGLLTFKPAPPKARELQCKLPNEYARRSLQHMVETALPGVKVPEMAQALHARSPAAFNQAARQMLECVPNTALRAGSTRESIFQVSLFGAMYCALSSSDATVSAEFSTQRGKVDKAGIRVHFHRQPEALWVIEVGLADAAKGDAEDTKLAQMQQYAKSFSHPNLYCCAVLASADSQRASEGSDGPIVAFAWSRRLQAGEQPIWEPVKAV